MSKATNTCHVCGKLCRGVACISCRHTHRTSLHIKRIESQFQLPITQMLNDLYVVQKLGTPAICQKLGIQLRALRFLLAHCNIPLRTHSEAVANQWIKDDGTRRQAQGERMALIGRRGIGDNNPAKNPKVGAKISAYKKLHNPMHSPEVRKKMGLKKTMPRVTKMCLQCRCSFKVLITEAHRRILCSVACRDLYQGISGLEIAMESELAMRGFRFTKQHPILNYRLDFAFVDLKIAIECDGRGWHTPEKDAIRDARLLALGWHTFRYSQDAIYASISRCVDDLIANLQSLGLTPPFAP